MKKVYKYIIGAVLIIVFSVMNGYVCYKKGVLIEGTIAAEETYQKLEDISREYGFDFDWFQ